MENLKKVVIIGGPGTGKTTLANNLGKKLNLPVYHIDAMHHLENWKLRDSAERDKLIIEKANEPKWIIDGTYKTTLEIRIEKSDLVIFLNYSATDRLKGIFSRYIKNRGKEKKDIPGCKEKLSWDFIKLTANWHKTRVDYIEKVIEKTKDKQIIIFKSRRNLNRWYQEKFGEKIEL